MFSVMFRQFSAVTIVSFREIVLPETNALCWRFLKITNLAEQGLKLEINHLKIEIPIDSWNSGGVLG